jgi:SAM-dependent methyltransferase
MKKLNLGSGREIKPKSEGWDNLDKTKLPGVDLVMNLDDRRWKIKDNTYDYIECIEILEHLNNWPHAMEEIWRISKPGAKVYIEVPFFPSMYSVIDPTHKSFFTYQTFEYFEPNHCFDYYTKAKFKIRKRYIRFSWNKILNILAIPINWFPIFYSRYWAFILPSNILEVELEVVK